MKNIEIMDLTKINPNFPEPPKNEISRENFLVNIDVMFEDNQVVIIDGKDGIGKTTILAQYANKYKDNAISLFIRGGCKFGYEPEYLRNILCEQMHWAITNENLDNNIITDTTFYQSEITKLLKHAHRKKAKIYFVIDGIDEIPNDDEYIINLLVKDILPFGFKQFYFLMSGNITGLFDKYKQLPQYKTFTLPPFSFDQTINYLKYFGIENSYYQDIHKMCGGIPGNLSCVTRMIESKKSIQSIMSQTPENLPSFIALEMDKVHNIKDDQKLILALIAFGQRDYSINIIARVLNLEPSGIESFLRDLGFMAIDERTKKISCISEQHRKILCNTFKSLKIKITSIIIDDLIKNKDEEASLLDLPKYYEQAERLDDLIEFLTPDYLFKVLSQSKSLTSVADRVSMGLSASRSLSKKDALIRFSMQMSVITEFDGYETWKSEIEARMAVDDYSTAFSLAETAILKSDQLRLFALIARLKKQKNQLPDESLIDRIYMLYGLVDHHAIGVNNAIEIASDLIWSDPDLAINLIEKVANISGNGDSIDIAFANFSINALITADGTNECNISEAIVKSKFKIKDPKLQDFTDAVSIFFSDYSSDKIISYIEKLEFQNRLYFVRQWALANPQEKNSSGVIDYALDILLKNTPYTPKTRDLLEIATPLPAICDELALKKLIGKFDSIKGSIIKYGATEDYIRLQLQLAEAERKYDFVAVLHRILEIYFEICQINNLSVKANCLAWVVSKLKNIDPQMEMEKLEGLHTLFEIEFESSVKELLEKSSDHYNAFIGSIRALSKYNSELAIKLALSLNIQQRRDNAIYECIMISITVPHNDINFTVILESYKYIENSDLRNNILVAVIRRLSSLTIKSPDIVAKSFPLFDAIKNMKDAYRRCLAASYAHSFYIFQDELKYSGLCSSLLEILDKSLESIDVGWIKVNMGFLLVENFATYSPDLARKYLANAEKIKSEIIIGAEKLTIKYLACVRLCIRIFSGLLPKDYNSSERLDQLISLIDRIPSNGERSILFGEIALRCFINKKQDLGEKIVFNNIKPLINKISDIDHEYKQLIYIEIAPSLYSAHKATTLADILKMDKYRAEDAYIKICNFLLKNIVPSDPYEYVPGNGFVLTYERIVDLCEILELMYLDRAIYSFIKSIVDSVINKRNKHNYTQEQRSDIINRLENIANNKFPDTQNIRHDGYKIISLSEINRLRRHNSNGYEILVAYANNITNIADRSLILTQIANSRSDKNPNHNIFEDAINLCGNLPLDIDRIDRNIDLAQMLKKSDIYKSKECLKAAMNFSETVYDSNLMVQKQKKIIDIAHNIEPNFASGLATLVDNDIARLNAKVELKSHIEMLKYKKGMAENKQDISIEHENKSYCSKAAWLNLGELNAGRLKTIHSRSLIPFVLTASKLPIQESFPIFSWIIENTIQRHSKSNEIEALLVPIFQATFLAAELAWNIAARSAEHFKHVTEYNELKQVSNCNECIIIKNGDREKAINYIELWLKEAKDYIIISDPYFGINDLEILQIIKSYNSNLKVSILTSKRQQLNDKLQYPWEDEFRKQWGSISYEDPPWTKIVIVGSDTKGASPIHDRWWLTNGNGINVGTSFNSLGFNTSKIKKMTGDEVLLSKTEIDQYLLHEKQDLNGEKLRYQTFSL